MVVQEVFGVGWAGRRKLRDGFCGQTGRLKADARSPACLAGSGTGSDLVYLWTGDLVSSRRRANTNYRMGTSKVELKRSWNGRSGKASREVALV